MAIIKAGTYTMKEVLSLPSTSLSLPSIVLSIGDYGVLPANGTIDSRQIYLYGVEDMWSGAIFYDSSSGWGDPSYRQWTITEDSAFDDDFSTWFTSNLYAPYYEITAASAEGVVLHIDGKVVDKDIKVTFPNSGDNLLTAKTETKMNALLIADNIGKVAQFNGISSTYVDGGYYLIEALLSMITFTIGGTSYQAEEGMTWEEWVNSKYNTEEYYISGTKIYNSEGTGVVSEAISTDKIVADKSYSSSHSGGAN